MKKEDFKTLMEFVRWFIRIKRKAKGLSPLFDTILLIILIIAIAGLITILITR
jgi:hypothetical protein